MTAFYVAVALLLLSTLVAGLWRILRGPTSADRMLAAQLFGTVAVASLLLLAQASGNPSLRDVALVFALLAAVTVVAFVRRVWRSDGTLSAPFMGARKDGREDVSGCSSFNGTADDDR